MDELILNAYATVSADISLNDYNKLDLEKLLGHIENDTVYDELSAFVKKLIDSGTFKVNDNKNCPVAIKVSAKGPSSVNGWDVSINATNNSQKTVKYIVFNVIGYNSVDDPVFDDFGTRCKYTGPLKPGKADRTGVWTVYMESKMQRDKFEATNVEIEFMDGSAWPEETSNEETKKLLDKLFFACHENKRKLNR